MPTFQATITDTAGRTVTSSPLFIPEGTAPGTGGTGGTGGTPPPAATYTENFEAAVTPGTALSTSNTIFSGYGSATGTATFNATSPLSGLGAAFARFTAGSVTQAVSVYKTLAAAASTQAIGFYLRVPGATLPAAALNVCNARTGGTPPGIAGTTVAASVRLQTDGTLILRDGAASTGVASTTVLTPGTWYRLEWKLIGATSQELRIYGAAGTLVETMAGRALTAASIDNFLLGITNGLTGFDLDIDGVDIGADFPGPWAGVGGGTGGGGTTPPPTGGSITTIYAATNNTGDINTSYTQFSAAVGAPPVTGYHGYSGANIPTNSTFGSANTAMLLAKNHGLALYLNTKTSAGQTGGQFTSSALNYSLVTSVMRQCVAWLKANGIRGWVTLDHEPQDNVGADSAASRASAARWRAAQRVAARAVWAEDPTGQIGYSVCIMSQFPGFSFLQRSFWDPGASYTDDVAGSTPWTATEKAKVLWAPDSYATINGDGTFENFFTKNADYDFWLARGYPKMGVGEFAYKTNAGPTEQRVADLIRGWAGTSPPPELGGSGSWIVGSLGHWLYQKSVVEGSLRSFAWYDNNNIATLERGSLIAAAAGFAAINSPLRVAAFQTACSQIGVAVA